MHFRILPFGKIMLYHAFLSIHKHVGL